MAMNDLGCKIGVGLYDSKTIKLVLHRQQKCNVRQQQLTQLKIVNRKFDILNLI